MSNSTTSFIKHPRNSTQIVLTEISILISALNGPKGPSATTPQYFFSSKAKWTSTRSDEIPEFAAKEDETVTFRDFEEAYYPQPRIRATSTVSPEGANDSTQSPSIQTVAQESIKESGGQTDQDVEQSAAEKGPTDVSSVSLYIAATGSKPPLPEGLSQRSERSSVSSASHDGDAPAPPTPNPAELSTVRQNDSVPHEKDQLLSQTTKDQFQISPTVTSVSELNIRAPQGRPGSLSSSSLKVRSSSGSSDTKNPLAKAFAALRQLVLNTKDVRGMDLVTLVTPVVEVIRSGNSSGQLTITALTTIEKLFSYGIIDQQSPNLNMALSSIAYGVTHCRFEASHTVQDELVLLKILSLLDVMLDSEVTRFFNDQAIKSIISTAFGILFQGRSNELLVRAGQQTLRRIGRRIMTRIFELSETDDIPVESPKGEQKGMSNKMATNHKPFGVPSLREYLSVLVSVFNPSANKSGDVLRTFALKLFKEAIELAGPRLAKFPSLRSAVGDDACRCLLQIIQRDSNHPQSAIAALRACHTVFSILRGSLKHQFELFMVFLLDRLAPLVSLASMNLDCDRLVSDRFFMAALKTVREQEEKSGENEKVASPLSPKRELMDADAGQGAMWAGRRMSMQALQPLKAGRFSFDCFWVQACGEFRSHSYSLNINQALLMMRGSTSSFRAIPDFRTFDTADATRDASAAANAAGISETGQFHGPWSATQLQKLRREIDVSLRGSAEFGSGFSLDDLDAVAKDVVVLLADVGSLGGAAPTSSGSVSRWSGPFGVSSLGGASLITRTEPAVRDVMIEILLTYLREGTLLRELYYNYDCNPASGDLFAEVFKFIAKLALPPRVKTDVSDVQSQFFLRLLLNALDEFDSGLPKRVDTKASELESKRKRKLVASMGAKLFNDNFKVGLRFLRSHGLCPDADDPEGIARFLKESPMLSKQALGDLFSRPENVQIVKAYIDQFNFHGKRPDEALRMMLFKFRLPREAQQIERIIESFAQTYFRTEPDNVATEDAGFVLAYAIIMLNTDQHNPQVKRRMTLDQFSANLRGQNDGKDFDATFLEAVYDAIRTDEIVLPEEQEGPAGYDNLWQEMLLRSVESGDYLCPSKNVFGKDMFSSIWKTALVSLAYLFDKSENEDTVLRCMIGFHTMARIAAKENLTHVQDHIVICLALMSSLLPPEYPYLEEQFDLFLRKRDPFKKPLDAPFPGRTSAPSSYVHDYKGHLATVALFNVVHEGGSATRRGWIYVVQALKTLLSHELVPEDMLLVYDHVKGPVPLPEVMNRKGGPAVKTTSIFSTLSSYIMGSSTDSRRYAEDSKQKVLDAIQACPLSQIFRDGSQLDKESLYFLVSSMIFASQKQGTDSEETPALYDDSMIFFLELITVTVGGNIARTSRLWQITLDHFSTMLKRAKHVDKAILNRAVASVLRLAGMIVHKAGDHELAGRLVELVFSIDRANIQRVSVQVIAGVGSLVADAPELSKFVSQSTMLKILGQLLPKDCKAVVSDWASLDIIPNVVPLASAWVSEEGSDFPLLWDGVWRSLLFATVTPILSNDTEMRSKVFKEWDERTGAMFKGLSSQPEQISQSQNLVLHDVLVNVCEFAGSIPAPPGGASNETFVELGERQLAAVSFMSEHLLKWIDTVVTSQVFPDVWKRILGVFMAYLKGKRIAASKPAMKDLLKNLLVAMRKNEHLKTNHDLWKYTMSQLDEDLAAEVGGENVEKAHPVTHTPSPMPSESTPSPMPSTPVPKDESTLSTSHSANDLAATSGNSEVADRAMNKSQVETPTPQSPQPDFPPKESSRTITI